MVYCLTYAFNGKPPGHTEDAAEASVCSQFAG